MIGLWVWVLLLFILFPSFLITNKVMNVIQLRKIEMNDWNTLYECTKCGKLHRKYQEEISYRLDSNYKTYLKCTSCYHPVKLYTNEEFDWMKISPEFPKITTREIKKMKKTLRNLEKYKKLDSSIEEFMKYYRLVPPNEHKQEK